MKSEKHGRFVAVRLKPTQAHKLEMLCENRGLNFSQTIRELITSARLNDGQKNSDTRNLNVDGIAISQ